MKSIFAYTSFLLALSSPLVSAAPIAAEAPEVESFVLRALTPRDVDPPITGKLEVVGSDIVVNAGADHPGFETYVEPNPKGSLKSHDEGGLGYLFPNPEVDGLYDFRFGGVPKIAGVLYTDFFATSAGCGSHCGGPQLVYDETPDDDKYSGNWLAAQREEGGHFIRWYNGEDSIPADHTVVYLMRDTV